MTLANSNTTAGTILTAVITTTKNVLKKLNKNKQHLATAATQRERKTLQTSSMGFWRRFRLVRGLCRDTLSRGFSNVHLHGNRFHVNFGRFKLSEKAQPVRQREGQTHVLASGCVSPVQDCGAAAAAVIRVMLLVVLPPLLPLPPLARHSLPTGPARAGRWSTESAFGAVLQRSYG